ncbi:hypothetical protein ACEPAH_6661 [Sanghuangporus vaninii]
MFVLRRACRRQSVALARFRSTLTPLPPLEEWRNLFPLIGYQHRITLKNQDTADKLAKSFFADTKTSDDGKIVIEAFPGPGCLTRSLMKLSKNKIKKLIVLEDDEPYLPYLKPLEEVDPRVKIIPMSGFAWPTYTALEAEGLLDDVIRKEWNGEIPNLHFVAHIPNSVLGEQLTNQFIRHIPERSWLFKYGRVPMSLLLSDYSYRRMTATNMKTEYCKLSVVAQAAASIKPVISREKLQPYKDHFHPLGSGSEIVERKGSKRPAGAPYVAIQVNALQEQVIETGKLDKWDYVLRRMFVLKTTPIRRAISSLGPGAYNLLKRLGDPNLPPEERLDINKKVRELEMRDWSILVKRFDEWPFRPGDLDISEAIYKDVEREK